MASSSFNRIHSALAMFQNDFGTKGNYSEDSGVPSLDSGTELNELFKLSSDIYLYSHQLDDDWMFLRMFTVSVHKWSDAGKLLQKSGREEWVNLVVRIESVANEIARKLWKSICSFYCSENPSELLNLLKDCKRITDPLKVEVGQILDYVSQSGGSSYHFDPPLAYNYSDWSELFGSVIEGLLFLENTTYSLNYPDLRKQLYVFHEELNLMEKYLYDVKATLVVVFDDVIKSFLGHVASVLVGTAYHYCNYGSATKKTKSKWLTDNVHTICEEIIALLTEAASLHLTVRKEAAANYPSRSELLVKVCLLKAECFLKNQLEEKTPSLKIEDFNEVLESQRRFTIDLPHEKIEYGNQMLALTEEVAKEGNQMLALTEEVAKQAISLYQDANKSRLSTMKNSPLRLLFKIVIFKAESFLVELLKITNASFMVHRKDHVESLLKELKFFKRMLTNQLMIKIPEDMKLIIIQTEPILRRLTSFSCLINSSKTMQEIIEKVHVEFPKLLKKAKQIKAKLKGSSFQFPKFHFPKTYELGFVDFLLRNLKELLTTSHDSIAPVRHDAEAIQQHLESLTPFLLKVSKSDIDEHPELKVIGNQVMHVAYKIEYVINSMELGACWPHLIWFYDLLGELELLSERASSTHVTTYDAQVQNVNDVTEVSRNMISQDSTRATNDVVDLRDEEGVIIDQLIGGSSNRNIVSIVGMAGIGKTTLASQVYNCKHVEYRFHRRAWCTVSQIYEKREMLLEILSDIQGHTVQIHQMSTADLESKLRQSLLKNRYLIVMDDIWDIGAWRNIENSFPDDNNGSRILITSRLCDVALDITPHSDPHPVRLFSDDESWMLLEKKIFRGKDCPEEILPVGKKIAKQCKGLPLAVVAIAGLLERMEKRRDWWEKIAESLSSEIMKDTEAQCMEILELSYKHLPGHLKACFLYLAAFLEDKDIPVSKLIQFWLAEGFIQETKSKHLEDVAEDYLMDLINRSLVVISKRKSNGKVKACRLHDLIRDLCQSKAKEENFLQLVTRSDETDASFPISDYGFDFDFDQHLDPVTYEAYRLSIFLKRKQFVDSRPSGSGTRALIFFASTDLEPRCPYDISFICQNFKFLRVLDLECINLGISFPIEIGLLIQLRYLAVSGYMGSVPRSIANLRKLETFSVTGFHGKVILPDTIWQMSSLRHLHVNKYVSFDCQDEEVVSSLELYNLVSFSRPALRHGEYAEKILKKLPNLLKLRCIFLESWNSSKDCNQFPRLSVLSHLESLKILYFGRTLNASEMILPLNLKKLTLSHFRLPWNQISVIGRLPKLEVLKLFSGAFEGQRWDMREEEFQELKFLKLENLNMVEWNAYSDHLPKLQRLVLQNCKDLEKIPNDFGDITTLETIEVLWCRQSVEESAKEIGEATSEIKVLISSS